MRHLIFAFTLLAPLGALAQTPAAQLLQPGQPDPEKQALAATIIQLTQEGVALRTQIFVLQAELERLKAEVAKQAAGAAPTKP